MNILIIGTGYVGLVSGACLAEMGHSVTCLDVDAQKIEKLKTGMIPFYEPGLQELVLKNIQRKSIIFSTSYENSVPSAEAIFLAVPTPSKEDGSCDLSYFSSAANTVAKHLAQYAVIVNKSTVPVGTALMIEDSMKKILEERGMELEFDVVSNPEFLKEGNAVADCLNPDRLILGVSSAKAESVMKKLYEPLIAKGYPVIIMDRPSAEMTKYAANAMLATRISFMNELSLLCQKTGASIHHVKTGIGSDRRIGPSFLNAGIGFGGSCFPKDIRALKATASEYGVETPILEAIEEVNSRQKKILVNMMEQYFSSRDGLKGKTIAIWGLSFKPETDDMREAPSLDIIQELRNKGASVKAFDPIALSNAQKAIDDHSGITWCDEIYAVSENVDAIALVTEWNTFLQVDMKRILSQMGSNAFFDGRNLFDANKMRLLGFDYHAIGIPHFSLLMHHSKEHSLG